MTKENADISRFSKILQPKVYNYKKKNQHQKLTFIVLFWFLIKNRFIQKRKKFKCQKECFHIFLVFLLSI